MRRRRPWYLLAAVVLVASVWSALALANLDRVAAILAFVVDRSESKTRCNSDIFRVAVKKATSEDLPRK